MSVCYISELYGCHSSKSGELDHIPKQSSYSGELDHIPKQSQFAIFQSYMVVSPVT